jgi:hypothetical protein
MPRQRVNDRVDIAAMVVFLASPGARDLTGKSTMWTAASSPTRSSLSGAGFEIGRLVLQSNFALTVALSPRATGFVWLGVRHHNSRRGKPWHYPHAMTLQSRCQVRTAFALCLGPCQMRRRQISARQRRSEVHEARCLKHRAHFLFCARQSNERSSGCQAHARHRQARKLAKLKPRRSGQDDRWAAEARARRSFDALLESRSA